MHCDQLDWFQLDVALHTLQDHVVIISNRFEIIAASVIARDMQAQITSLVRSSSRQYLGITNVTVQNRLVEFSKSQQHGKKLNDQKL